MPRVEIRILFLFSALGFFISGAQGQLPIQQEKLSHEVKIKADRFVFFDDQVFYTYGDTIVTFPDSVDFYIKRNSMKKTDEFYELIEDNMSKGSFSQAIYNVVFQTASQANSNYFSKKRFEDFEDEIISQVTYRHLPIFGTNVLDTSQYEATGFTDFMNKIHLHTRTRVIRNNLTFSEGSVLHADDLVDSERLLRNLDFIQDARVYVRMDSLGSTEAHVVTKDLLPWNLILSPNQENYLSFGIVYNNIGGLGHELEYQYLSNRDINLGVGSDFYYRIKSIKGSYIDVELNYAANFHADGYGVDVQRQFVTQDIKYAGGLKMGDYELGEISYYNHQEDSSNIFFYDQGRVDSWLGRSFRTNFRAPFLGIENKANLVFSSRFDYQNFSDVPGVTADSVFRFHDRKDLLFGIGLSSRKFFTDRFVLNFGRTEDIPTGGIFGLIAGYQFGEFQDRAYIGVNYARGAYLRRLGYMNISAELGGYIAGDSFVQDGVGKIQADFFSRLIIFNQYKMRQFLNVSIRRMINPREPEFINTEFDLGIRGVRRYFLTATEMFNLRWETMLFTPINLIGFRLAAFGYTDYVAIRDSFQSEDVENYWGIGLGIRLRNDNLAFQTIQLRFSFFPDTPDGSRNVNLHLASAPDFEIRDFNYTAPEIVSF